MRRRGAPGRFTLAGLFVLAAAPAGALCDPATPGGRGSALYAVHCAACHGPALEGGSAVALSGEGFRQRWRGLSADDLYHVVRSQMPWGNPGLLSDSQGRDVTIHILRNNAHPLGLLELPAEAAARARMVLEW